MKRIFGIAKKKKKEKPPPMTVEETTEQINRRCDVADDKIRKLDAVLLGFKEQIRKTRPGPMQEALKSRALRILKQKKMYEAQRDMLHNQSFKLESVSFATEGIKDAQQTMVAMKAGNKELEATFKTLKIEDVDKLQDQITNIFDESNEIQDSMLQGQSHLDEDDLQGELDALEDEVKTLERTNVVLVQNAVGEEKNEDRLVGEIEQGKLQFPSPPRGQSSQILNDHSVPVMPRSSIHT